MPRAEPLERNLIVSLASFVGITALAGGSELLLWPHGNPYVPTELIADTGFSSFLIPGLLLVGVVALTSLVAATLSFRRHRYALDATILAGGALTVWILAECALFRAVHWLHLLYGALGVGLLALGVHGGLVAGVPRQRWVIVVTASEATGFVVPALTGLLCQRLGIEGGAQVAALTAAGFLEGLALGAGQASALPIVVKRFRYALLTACGAAFVWCVVMLMVEFVLVRDDLPLLLSIGVAVAVAVLGLLAIGCAQWFELRHHSPHARAWIGWTALAWIVALPFSFTPSPLVDQTTPIASHVVLWSCAGWLMAYVMALVTWQGARRLQR